MTDETRDTNETKPDDRKWCYQLCRDDETAFGPFDSREEAIREARAEFLEPGGKLYLSRCDYPDPGDKAPTFFDEDDLLEDMNQQAIDDGEGNVEGDTFEPIKGAEIGHLNELIKDWCRRNIKAVWFNVDPECIEEVTL